MPRSTQPDTKRSRCFSISSGTFFPMARRSKSACARENFLPAAGVGLRFVISEKHRVSLAADIATGKEGTEFYFGVGEAF